MTLWSLTATETAALVARRDVSAREVCEASLGRMAAANPGVNAVVTPCEDEARAAADAVDAALSRGEPVGPLAGVPVTVKVIVDQVGHATTNGLRLQENLIATSDNPVVAALRGAGAVIIGRTNTPAFSLRWFTRNSLHGATLNPVFPGRTPGGSSGGASAATALGIGAIGHGTDIAGSIRYPAYACGLHGLRPGLGRVAAFNESGGDRLIGAQLMAVSGPIARSIPDLALGLAVMARPDARDPWHQAVPLAGPPGPRRVALALAPDGLVVDPAVTAGLHQAARRLADAGWTVDEVPLPPLRAAMEAQLRLWLAEFRHTGGAAVAREGDPDASLVYARLCAHTPEIDMAGLMATLQDRSRLVRLWRGFLRDWPLVLMPVSGALPFADHLDVGSQADFDHVLQSQMPMIATPFMGLPGLTVTLERHADHPVAVQLVADQFREDLLLEAGAVLGPVMPVVA